MTMHGRRRSVDDLIDADEGGGGQVREAEGQGQGAQEEDVLGGQVVEVLQGFFQRAGGEVEAVSGVEDGGGVVVGRVVGG